MPSPMGQGQSHLSSPLQSLLPLLVCQAGPALRASMLRSRAVLLSWRRHPYFTERQSDLSTDQDTVPSRSRVDLGLCHPGLGALCSAVPRKPYSAQEAGRQQLCCESPASGKANTQCSGTRNNEGVLLLKPKPAPTCRHSAHMLRPESLIN